MANLREEYTQHIHNTVPDMDKLWGRISDEIDKRETNDRVEEEAQKNREQIKRSGGYMKITAVAAAFIVIFAGINIVNESNKAQTAKNKIPLTRSEKNTDDFKDKTSGAKRSDYAEEAQDGFKSDNVEAAQDNYKSDEAAETTAEVESTVKYEQLSFNETDTQPFKADYIPGGNEFFVESDVLSQTDLFVDVMVIGVDLRDDNGADYALLVNNVYYRDESIEPISTETLKIHSSTPYILQENRQYLIPLKKGAESGKYSIVFENAPQIEITLDGGAVFQNGWTALNKDSQTLEKHSLNVNDFYFDRMKYIPYLDINELITEWKNA